MEIQLRMTTQHPDFPRYNELVTKLHQLNNPQCWFDKEIYEQTS